MNPLESESLLYRVGNIEIDARTATVRRAGRELSLQPKVFGVLQYLLENRDRVISKGELLRAIWQGEPVHESTVPWSIGHVRDALGQRRGARQPIETVHKRGYRFAARVEVVGRVTTPDAAGDLKGATRLHRSNRHSSQSGSQPDSLPGSQPEASPSQLGDCDPPAQAPFVGRDAVLERLAELLEATASGRGHLCIIQGVPGIGKTRVTQEAARMAVSLGFRVHSGRLVPDGGSPSFWPWIQILRDMQRDWLADAPTTSDLSCQTLISQQLDSLEAIGQIGTLKSREPAADGGSHLQDERAARFWLIDGLSRFLLGPGSQAAPLLLCIDDVHWADDGTLSMLNFMASELKDSRVLVLVTERVQGSAPWPSKLARVLQDAQRIELGALDTDDVRAYIAQRVGVSIIPLTLADAVHTATTGNPLLVQETVRELLRQHGSRHLLELDPSYVKLPASAKEVLGIGLRALDAQTRSVLDHASILGASFELPLLQALIALTPEALLVHLEPAERSGLVVRETPQRYRFSHALLQELVYDELPAAQRALLHLKAAEALEALSRAEPHYAEIAHHFYRSLPAGTHARAEAAALSAARAAEQMLEYADAARLYGWALEAQAHSPELTPRDRADLLFVTGRAQRYAGQAENCRSTLERMFDIARQHGFADLLLRGARVLRPTFAISVLPDPTVRAALDDAAELLDARKPTGDAPLDPKLAQQQIMALSHLACIPPYSSDLNVSKSLTERALDQARSLGHRAPLLEALRARLYSLSGPDDTEALLQVADEMLELERKRPTHMTLEAHSARCGALLYRGEQAAADQALARFGRVTHELQLPEAAWYYERQRAQGCILRGDYDSGIAAVAELHASGRRIGLGYGEEFLAALQRRVRHDIRRVPNPSLPLEERSLVAHGFLDFIPNTRAQNARFAAEIGELSKARSSVDWLASQGFENLPREISYLNTLVNLAMAVVRLSDRERAEQLYTMLSPYAQFNTPDGYLYDEGSVSHYLALLADTLGWDERVEAHFRTALIVNRDLGRRPQLARTYFDFAVWAAEQDRSGASALAQSLAHEASILAESIGMQWLAQQARSLMT